MTDSEKQDLETLKADIQKIKIFCFDHQYRLSKLSAVELGHAGYRNRGEAVFRALQRAKQEIDHLTKLHITNYPDEGK